MSRILFFSTILWALNYKLFFSLFESYGDVYEAVYEIIAYYVIILFLSLFFSFNKVLNLIFLNILFTVSIVGVYFINSMGIVIDGSMLNNVLSTDSTEALELLNISFYIYMLIAAGALYLLNKHLLLKQKSLALKEYALSSVLVLIIAFGLFKLNRDSLDRFMATDTPKVAPTFLIPSIGEYINLRDRLVEINKKNISAEYKLQKDTNNTIVVFIMGESARGDRFGVNGYSKDTTPKLSQEKNLISFKDATSCHTSTLNSIPCLMTRVEKKDYDITIAETSFVQIFRDLGYATYWFSRHSNQKRVNTFCEEAVTCEYLPNTLYDMALVDKFKKVEFDNKNSFVVLHTLGSHFDYNEREPDAYKIFQPLCSGNVSGCSKETLDNSYDNTIYYTDEFMYQLIEFLKDKNACIVFTSDHGESLGEDSMGLVARYGHSTPPSIAPKEQSDVPFMLWFSDKYLENHPDVNIEKIKKEQSVSHDNIFDTTLGCGNIQNRVKSEKNLNLLSR